MNLRESSKDTRRHFAKYFTRHLLNGYADSEYITITIRELKDIIIRERDITTKRTVARVYKGATS